MNLLITSQSTTDKIQSHTKQGDIRSSTESMEERYASNLGYLNSVINCPLLVLQMLCRLLKGSDQDTEVAYVI